MPRDCIPREVNHLNNWKLLTTTLFIQLFNNVRHNSVNNFECSELLSIKAFVFTTRVVSGL